MTTCIPVPRRAQGARVLQRGGGRLQSQQAKSFCQGCLHQLHLLLLHLKPPAQGLQGLLSGALTWERGKKPSACHPPPTTPHTHLGKGLREFSPPLTLHLSNRTPPAPSNSRLGRAPRGEETMGKGSRASFWQGRRGTWQSSLPAACPSLRKDREYHGVPGGKYGVLPRNVGTTDGGAVLDEGRQGPAQSNRRTPGKAAKLRGSTRREAGDSEDSHPEHSEEKRSGVTGEG